MKRNLFAELKEGFEAYEQHRQGKITLNCVEVEMPAPVMITPEEIRAIRESLNFSQAVFARKLRTSVRTYQGWEQGKTKPNPQAALLLRMVERSPKTFAAIAAA
ncbi:helix-turn-helix domain-containing protein [Neisseria lisongii]|uniref:Helix-turn-helix domain-containing protein n=1 Tax=Neisseria lisongii TaxID=2912188 RepID=A0AAW5AML9_9NEIS|nr:helix-turn-helix domain-containing protein [Neisseria lisongii]MCF7528668.1 helix-turn-helix domain-containing protein [Neisseria lisongii]MCF7529526.1 helix-turn-helix domain-containing protein [Neisseria lisongii]